MDEEVAKLDFGAKERSELEAAVATSEPAEHGRLECDLRSAVRHANAEEDCMRLGCDAMDTLVKCYIYPTAAGIASSDINVGVDNLLQGQLPADGTEACQSKHPHKLLGTLCDWAQHKHLYSNNLGSWHMGGKVPSPPMGCSESESSTRVSDTGLSAGGGAAEPVSSGK
eukprot:4669625-Prymnesium_polylepis.4